MRKFWFTFRVSVSYLRVLDRILNDLRAITRHLECRGGYPKIPFRMVTLMVVVQIAT